SYTPERAAREDTVRLWRKVRTVEDPEWTRRFTEPAPLDKDHGARVVATFKDGSTLEEEIAVANAHPRGAKPYGRDDYIQKFHALTEGLVEPGEVERFLSAAAALTSQRAPDLGEIDDGLATRRLKRIAHPGLFG